MYRMYGGGGGWGQGGRCTPEAVHGAGPLGDEVAVGGVQRARHRDDCHKGQTKDF